MKKIVLFALGMAMSMTTFAQEEVETTISADVVSSYIWRGQDLGSTAFQPTLGVAYKGLSLTAWGSYGLVNPADTKEFDLTLAYTIGNLNIGVTDYWFNAMPTGGDPENRYFKYDAHSTNHVFEANVGYDFGVASLQWSAVILRLLSHLNLLLSTGLLRLAPSPLPPISIMAGRQALQ